jgi:hypothetical protein
VFASFAEYCRIFQNIGKQDSAKLIELIFSLTLIHAEKKPEVLIVQAITKPNLSQNNSAPYQVPSSIRFVFFRSFVSASEGKAIQITNMNFIGFLQVGDEFDFD